VATSLGPGATSPIRGPPRNCESSLREETSAAQLTAPLLPRAPRPSRRTGGWRPQRAAEELVFRCPELGFMARNHHLVRQSRDMGLLNAEEPRELGDGGRRMAHASMPVSCPRVQRPNLVSVPLARAAYTPYNNTFGLVCPTLAESTCDSVTGRQETRYVPTGQGREKGAQGRPAAQRVESTPCRARIQSLAFHPSGFRWKPAKSETEAQ